MKSKSFNSNLMTFVDQSFAVKNFAESNLNIDLSIINKRKTKNQACKQLVQVVKFKDSYTSFSTHQCRHVAWSASVLNSI